MKRNYIQDIRNTFIIKKQRDNFNADGLLEIQNAAFTVDAPTVFGSANEDYINAEINWYETESRNVNDLFEIYGKRVKIWDDVSDMNGGINSNYGWCVYSADNGYQYDRVLEELVNNPTSRRAVMYYTRPTMHEDAFTDGMSDHMCTYAVYYTLSPKQKYLEASVMMRSNDAIYGFANDCAWQKYVLQGLAADLSVAIGPIHWFANSLHIYPRHLDLVPERIK